VASTYHPVLVDVDGTVADISHRLHFVTSKPKNWKAFRDDELVKHDKPAHHVISVVNGLRSTGHAIIFVSGRTEDQRAATETWLNVHWLIPADQPLLLLMRANGDNRDDCIVKGEILAWLRSIGVEPWLAIDDRPKVLRMWMEAGLSVIQVGRSVGIGGDF